MNCDEWGDLLDSAGYGRCCVCGGSLPPGIPEGVCPDCEDQMEEIDYYGC